MLVGGLAIAVVLVWTAVASLPDGRLQVMVLDVGEGDAVFVETPAGQQVLVNGGPSPVKMTAHLGRRMPFWDRTLDLVVLTDPEEEHLAGLIRVLKRYEVANVPYVLPRGYVSLIYERWQELVQEKGVVPQRAIAGTRVALGSGVSLTVLHPTEEELADDPFDERKQAMVVRVD